MKLLLDVSSNRRDALPAGAADFIGGQLLTPLTGYTRWSKQFAVDNGAFSEFKADRFRALLDREAEAIADCLWVAVPDVVGSARRTLEIWNRRYDVMPARWPMAFVCQDGQEGLAIPWDQCQAIFIGGTTHWKMSQEAAHIIKAAKICRRLVHVGRVNTARRWKHFEKLGADTCDGTGFAKFDWMFDRLIHRDDLPLLEGKAN